MFYQRKNEAGGVSNEHLRWRWGYGMNMEGLLSNYDRITVAYSSATVLITVSMILYL